MRPAAPNMSADWREIQALVHGLAELVDDALDPENPLSALVAALRSLPPRFGAEIAIGNHVKVFTGGISQEHAWHTAFRRLDRVDTRRASVRVTLFKAPWRIN